MDDATSEVSSWVCPVPGAAPKEDVDGREDAELEDTDRPESGDVSLDEDDLLGGGGGGRSLLAP